MTYHIISLKEKDIDKVLAIYNDIIQEGIYFQRKTLFQREDFLAYIKDKSVYTLMDQKEVVGFFILRPNGGERIGHIANGTYGLKKEYRGKKVGKQLVQTSLEKAKEEGYLALQYNSVVATNLRARQLYKSLGFQELTKIPKGFQTDNGFVDMYIYFKTL